MELLPHKLIYN